LPTDTEPVARDNNTIFTLKLGDQTFVSPYSTDNRSKYIFQSRKWVWTQLRSIWLTEFCAPRVSLTVYLWLWVFIVASAKYSSVNKCFSSVDSWWPRRSRLHCGERTLHWTGSQALSHMWVHHFLSCADQYSNSWIDDLVMCHPV